MKQAIVTIVNRLGLHARPASKLVSIASRSRSEVFLENNGQRINAKSILGVIMLEVTLGSKLTIEVDGEDEEKTLMEIVELVESGFGDKEEKESS